MKAPVLCDTGALLDYLVVSALDHLAFKAAIEEAGTRYLPALVLAEVDYFLRDERDAMAALVADVSHGAFTLVPVTTVQLDSAMAIDRRFSDLGLGLVDSSLVAVAEELGVTRLLTRDVRHFRAVTLRSGKRLELVVSPSSPDGSRTRSRGRFRRR